MRRKPWEFRANQKTCFWAAHMEIHMGYRCFHLKRSRITIRRQRCVSFESEFQSVSLDKWHKIKQRERERKKSSKSKKITQVQSVSQFWAPQNRSGFIMALGRIAVLPCVHVSRPICVLCTDRDKTQKRLCGCNGHARNVYIEGRFLSQYIVYNSVCVVGFRWKNGSSLSLLADMWLNRNQKASQFINSTRLKSKKSLKFSHKGTDMCTLIGSGPIKVPVRKNTERSFHSFQIVYRNVGGRR